MKKTLAFMFLGLLLGACSQVSDNPQSQQPLGALAVLDPGDTERVSVDSNGNQAYDDSPSYDTVAWPVISADGRYVAFFSRVSNLVEGDTNGVHDVFVRDRELQTTTRVSVGANGVEADARSSHPAISADGNHVAFVSNASNLVEGDTNSTSDVFVYDRSTVTTTRVSVVSGGGQTNGGSGAPSISADGRFVVFTSYAGNLMADGTNGGNVFVHDRSTNTTTLVSNGVGGVEADGQSGSPVISNDGRYIAFQSHASNLVDGDTNDTYDVFVYERETGITTRVSVSSTGIEGNGQSVDPSISADGRYVAFDSLANNLIDGDNAGGGVIVHDRSTGATTLVSVRLIDSLQDFQSFDAAISADGRYVAYHSYADYLVENDTNGVVDVFLYDRVDAVTTRVSVDSSGAQANGASWTGELGSKPSVSGDGSYVAFRSIASNLVANDTNDTWDVFVHRQRASNGSPTADAGGPYVGDEGVPIAFDGSASSDPENSSLTYDWDFGDGVILTNAGPTPSHTYAGVSGASQTYTVTLTVTDEGGASHSGATEVTVSNSPGATGTEGITNSGSDRIQVTDDGGFVIGDRIILAPGQTVQEIKTVTGFGSLILDSTLTYSHAAGTLVVVDNPPMLTSISVTDSNNASVVPLTDSGVSMTLNAAFADAGILPGTHSATIDWGDDNSSSGSVNQLDDTVTGSHTYLTEGVYPVSLTVTENEFGGDATVVFEYVVIYNPDNGFVTGGGFIESPDTACPVLCGGASGKANFGFVSRYKKGASEPSGTTQFRFQAGDLNFHSDVQEWLVVNEGGTSAQFKGSGSINGQNDINGNPYKFMIWAGDASTDTFRIRIWSEYDGLETDMYDNGADQAIGGGSIRIHKQ